VIRKEAGFGLVPREEAYKLDGGRGNLSLELNARYKSLISYCKHEVICPYVDIR
jgi:hypothetical protein